MRRQWLQSLWERFSIYMKLPVLYLVTLLIATVYFSVYGYHSTTRLMLDALDRRLELATVAVELVLPEDYADRAIAPHGITPDEYARVQHLMKRIADTEGIYSLYALQ